MLRPDPSARPRIHEVTPLMSKIRKYEFAKKGFHYSALKAWNDLPAELRELPTQNSFKKQLKTYLKG